MGQRIELEFDGDEYDIDLLFNQLDEAGGDLSELIYRASLKKMHLLGESKNWVRREHFVRPSVVVDMSSQVAMEWIGHMMIMTVSLDMERFPLEEILSLRALFNLSVCAFFYDAVAGARDLIKLEI